MKKTKKGRIILTYTEAIKRLNPRGRIHTFRNPSFGLVGCDWDRRDVLSALKKAKEIHETGNQAQAMNHGLAIIDKGDMLFIETTPNKVGEKP